MKTQIILVTSCFYAKNFNRYYWRKHHEKIPVKMICDESDFTHIHIYIPFVF